MKKHLYILLILLSINKSLAQEKQSFEGIYKIMVQDFTTDELNKIKDESIKANLISRLEETKKREFILKGNLQNALFFEVEKLKIDKNQSSYDLTIGDKYFHNTESGNVYLCTEFSGKKYLVSNTFDLYQWKIANETKIINGFKCYKATGIERINDFRERKNYTLIAWFCPELPFKFGPERYFGLPGLIFEAYTENSREKYVLKSILFNEESIEITKPTGKEISSEEFTAIFNKTMKNLYEE